MMKWPRLKSHNDLRNGLVLASQYRKIIRGLIQICNPLIELTDFTLKLQWEEQAERRFLVLKAALTTAPVLGLGEFNKPFVVTTEAIDVDVGAILEQGLGDGPQPIACAIRQLQQAEFHYSAYEYALFGIV